VTTNIAVPYRLDCLHIGSSAVPVDVTTEVEIDRSRNDVAAYASDPDNATTWYENIKAVEWRTPPPAVAGSRIAFVATFLGRRLEYTYEVNEMVAGERFVMSTTEGPFPMETTYTWDDANPGGLTWSFATEVILEDSSG
jgi:hypothetical protein